MKEYLKVIIDLAKKSYLNDEIPVGCIIVKNGKIIAKSCNNRQKKKCVLGHAEVNAIIKAEKKLKDWRLDGCDMFVTLEPCNMCMSIINASRINNIYYLLENNQKYAAEREKNYIKIDENNYDKEEFLTFFQQYFKSKRK